MDQMEAGYRHEDVFRPAVDLGLETGEPTLNQKQQDKLVAYFYTHDANIIGQNEFELTDAQRVTMLDRLGQNVITPDDMSRLLVQIKGPADLEADPDFPAATFGALAGAWQERGILAHFSRGSLQGREHLVVTDLARFLRRNPEPVAFERDAQPFLGSVERNNGPGKRAEYEGSMRNFQRIVYGKRQQYYEQFQLLFGKQIAQDPRWQEAWISDSEESDVR